MSNYKHGIRTSRQATQLATPVTSDGCLQCIIGTAPVNLAADPYDTVNKPFVAYKKADAISALGYSDDFENYTLCQSVYATFDVFDLALVLFLSRIIGCVLQAAFGICPVHGPRIAFVGVLLLHPNQI